MFETLKSQSYESQNLQGLIAEFDRISLNCITLTEEICQKEALIQQKINDFNILRRENNALSKSVGDLNIEIINLNNRNEQVRFENTELHEILKKE